MKNPFPRFRVSSDDPRERGRQLGVASAVYVQQSVAVYRETFAHYAGLSWSEVQERALEFFEPIMGYDESIAREIEGLATGAAVSHADILAINARTELMFGLSILPLPECTSFFVGSSATRDGHVLLGQNWDWRPRTAATTILVEVEQPPSPSFVMLAEAGLIGKIGFNSAGLGVATNTLVSDLDDGRVAVPFHVVLRGILNSSTVPEGVDAVSRSERAASGNFLIASSAGDAVNLETGPGGPENLFATTPSDGLIAHSNNFECAIPFGDKSVGDWIDSPIRNRTLSRLLSEGTGRWDRHALPEALSNHTGFPKSICRHPDLEQHEVERASTVASWVIDLSDRVASVCAGPPCEGKYAKVEPSF